MKKDTFFAITAGLMITLFCKAIGIQIYQMKYWLIALPLAIIWAFIYFKCTTK